MASAAGFRAATITEVLDLDSWHISTCNMIPIHMWHHCFAACMLLSWCPWTYGQFSLALDFMHGFSGFQWEGQIFHRSVALDLVMPKRTWQLCLLPKVPNDISCITSSISHSEVRDVFHPVSARSE